MSKKHIYYTFKVKTGGNLIPTDFAYEVWCMKWDELEGSDDIPVEIYKVQPNNRTAAGGCSCPAWKWDCKHIKAVQEMIDTGKINEPHRWKWSESAGWEQLDDLHVDNWDLGE